MNGVPVTVLTAVYNGADHLDAAITSILAQRFTDFEFLLIDDGSTDATPDLLADWARRDSRIVLVRNADNLGLTRSLNRGIALARGEWIARQDADDISMPERLTRQMAFLAAHPEVGLLGTGMVVIDARGIADPVPRLAPENHTEICWTLLTDNPFFHTAVMFRRELAMRHPYDETWRYGQDFDLWGRLLTVTRGANLAEPLIGSRRHAGRVSELHGQQQQETAVRIARRRFEQLVPGHAWSMQEVFDVRRMVRSEWPAPEETWRTLDLALVLFDAFRRQEGMDHAISQQLQIKLFRRLWRSALALMPGREGWRAAGSLWRHGGRQAMIALEKEVVRALRGRFVGQTTVAAPCGSCR
ncbi:MAG: glycosyltransferase [Magnetococcales bacterium]|nr:glycosyltransferase [Magnetococcales bacterium]